MLKNYLTVAIRNIARNKLYAFINIAGLAVGLAGAILIMLFVRDELSFDRTTPDAENLYRVEVAIHPPGREPIEIMTSMYPLADALRSEIPGVVETMRWGGQNSIVRSGDKAFFEPIVAAEPNFFTLTGYPLLSGDAGSVLARPDAIVISRRLSAKYFGDANPVGQTLSLDGKHVLEIAGVMEDLPHNVHMRTDAVIPFNSPASRLYTIVSESDAPGTLWFQQNFFTYVRLASGTPPEEVVAQLPELVRRHVAPDGPGADMGDRIRLTLQPYHALHFSTHDTMVSSFVTPGGDAAVVYGFSLIAALVIGIAIVNFMNLATARATQRSREVGVRKVAGALRRQLIVQFLGESVLIAFFALALACTLTELVMPAFAAFLDRPLAVDYFRDWDVTFGVIGLALAAGLLGGTYPAFVLSSFRPATVLKSGRSGQPGSSRLRNALVVAQFAVSIALGVAAAVVYGQTSFASSYDVGFERGNILVLAGMRREEVLTVRDTLRNELLASGVVSAVAGSNDNPFSNFDTTGVVYRPGESGQPVALRQYFIEPEFFDIYGMSPLAGRLLSRDRGEDIDKSSQAGTGGQDGLSMVINEAAMRRLGYRSPGEAIGQVVREDIDGADGSVQSLARTIVGVVPDVHFESLRRDVAPTRYIYNPGYLLQLAVVLKGDPAVGARTVEEIWNRVVPGIPIRMSFLDETYRALYSADERRGEMFAAFTIVAILIACLGLFGLSAFTAERRTKEIGIRKVFGARVRDILALLIWQFSKPVLLANLIAWPVAWYYLSGWLEGFAYRVSLSPLYFVAAGLGALLIAWATVTTHSLRVAMAKPVAALRYE